MWRNDGKTFVGHGGSCPGYRTQLLLKTDEKVATIVMANALGVNPGPFAQRMYDIMAPVIKTAAKEPAKTAQADSGFSRYTGTYEASFGGEIAVLEWEDGLATLSLPTMEPLRNLTKPRHTAEHTFRRVAAGRSAGRVHRVRAGARRPAHPDAVAQQLLSLGPVTGADFRTFLASLAASQ